MLDAAKGEERALKAAEHPHNIPSKGYGPLKLYIRHKVGGAREILVLRCFSSLPP